MSAPAPWSQTVRLSEVQRGPATHRLEADPAARERIARLLDLPSLSRLSGEVETAPWLDGAELRARWSAELEQTCSVTADAFPQSPAGEFRLRVVPAGSRAAPAPDAEVSVDPEAEDPPDVLESETLDLAAYLVEHLALELDPFPRKPGAEWRPPEADAEPSPFAKLAALKDPR